MPATAALPVAPQPTTSTRTRRRNRSGWMLCVSIGSSALYKLQQCLVRLGQESDWEGPLTVLQALPQSKEALGMTSEPHGSVWVGKLAAEETRLPAGHRRHRDLIGDAHRAQADPACRINIPV